MTSELSERIAQLPVNARPRVGETTDSYIRRLARANHLKPSYLHGFVCGPPFWAGKPQVERLSAVSGRSAEALQHALCDASSPRGRSKPTARALHLHQHKALRQHGVDMTVLIQHDALDGTMSIRALSETWAVPRWLVRRVLNYAIFPARSTRRRRTALEAQDQALITSMIDKGMSAKEIWVELMGTHNVSVSFANLQIMASKRRKARRRRPKRSPAPSAAEPGQDSWNQRCVVA
ncbi:hypothetical protein ACFV9P_02445 [Streptomyces sp. NPDC059892]|uniref:hypothetical protein n=1 Tax=Streptomyces sp. NPDC059892 TaxID=3346989 RepID=UPI003658FFD9